jgi:hypothetical protein
VSNETDSFLQEVEEGVRQDRYVAFFNRWGVWIAAGAALALAAAGAVSLYRSWSLSEAQKRTEVFAGLQTQMREGDAANVAADFERLSKAGPQAFRAMALMELAAVRQSEGDMAAAIAAYDQAAAMSSDKTMKATAQLRAAYLVADSQDFAAVRGRIEPLIAQGGPVSYLARELLAVEAWEAGDVALARQTMEAIRLAFDAPEAVRNRAELLLAIMPEAAPNAAPAPPPAGDTP